MENQFNYIEVRRFKDAETVKRMDVTSQTERSIDRIEAGLNINMNHKEYYSILNASDTELEVF